MGEGGAVEIGEGELRRWGRAWGGMLMVLWVLGLVYFPTAGVAT